MRLFLSAGSARGTIISRGPSASPQDELLVGLLRRPDAIGIPRNDDDVCFMASLRRIEKLNVLFREQIAGIVDREMEFGEGVFVTITRVLLSPDARHATTFISVLGGDERDALALLEKNVYAIQQQVNRAIRMRPVAKIRFAIDEQERRREQVERSLGAIKQKREL